jgi:hypothetical protein
MDKRSDIWRHLQDHQTPPPQEVFDRLQRTLDQPDSDGRSGLGRLQDHAVSPPAFLSIKVSKAAMAPKKNLLRLILPYAAAACLLLVVAVIVIDRSASRPKPGPAFAHGVPAKTNNPIQKDTASNETAAALPGSATDSSVKVAATGQDLSPLLTIDGDRFALVDNNPLLTFTSFKYPALTSYVDKNTTGKLKIRLDQYTNIVLSPAMTSMIKDLYGTRSTGKPTRRARRTKERLEKWKTADEEYFDGKALPGAIGSPNPLDPIDLAEFLFSSARKLHSPATPAPPHAAEAPDTHPAATDDVTVSYALTLISKRKDNGIGETYNGGIETLFAGSSDYRGRLRLASLMRIQSAFLSQDKETITLLRESGHKKTSTRLTADGWARYNKKYLGLACNLTDDTISILGYVCKKATITLQDNRQIVAWYTPRIKKPACSLLEPAFSSLPGLVLQYEYATRKKAIRYTATAISRKPIDPAVFRIPSNP